MSDNILYIRHLLLTILKALKISLCFLSITYIVTFGVLRPMAYICGPMSIEVHVHQGV